MTRSVTIVNTSNWEHEDVHVVAAGNLEAAWRKCPSILQPGDSVVVGPYGEGDYSGSVDGFGVAR